MRRFNLFGSAAGFVVAVLVATFLITMLPAQRASAVSCFHDAWAVDARSQDTRYGIRTTLNLVINPDSTCHLERTVYIIRDFPNNLVEVGWFENGPSFPDDPCSDVLSPHVLVYAIVNGFIKCKTGTAGLTAGQDYSFRADNPDHDFDYVYYWDDDTSPDISLGFFSTDHKAGYPQMAIERGNTADSLRGDIGGVNSLGGLGNWGALSPPDLYSTGIVDGWDVCTWSGTNLVVKATC